MNRTTVALLAALEAVIVAAIGLAICVVPLTILWAAQYQLGGSFLVVWRAAADFWLVGHGVDLTIALDARTVATLGLPGAATPFAITIALLGFALLTAALGVRTGMRASETPFRGAGALSAIGTFLAISVLVTLTAGSAPVQPAVWQGFVLPPFVYALGIGVGFAFAALRDGGVRDGAGRETGGRDASGREGIGRDGAGHEGADRDVAGREGVGRDAVGRESLGRDAAGYEGVGRAGTVHASADRDVTAREAFGREDAGRESTSAPTEHTSHTDPSAPRWTRHLPFLATARTRLAALPSLPPIPALPTTLPTPLRTATLGALRAGSAATAMVIGVAALILTLLIFGNYGAIISLYEQLQTGVAGGIALTVAQLAFLPNLVVWLASWLVGPGFAIGTGSAVGPTGTALGPVPGLPLFGVIPAHGYSFGLVGIVVPLLAGFVAAALLRGTRRAQTDGPLSLFLTAVGIGIVAGIELGLLAWWSSGALGPGRLHDVGPNPWLVGAIAAAEVAVAAVIGLMAGGRARR